MGTRIARSLGTGERAWRFHHPWRASSCIAQSKADEHGKCCYNNQPMATFDCPLCGKHLMVARKEDAPWRPFCSERCKMVDLGRWFDGTYNISEPINPQHPPQADDSSGED